MDYSTRYAHLAFMGAAHMTTVPEGTFRCQGRVLTLLWRNIRPKLEINPAFNSQLTLLSTGGMIREQQPTVIQYFPG